MKKKYFLYLVILLSAGISFSSKAQNAWINEFHYDNASTDVEEFVEVVIENAGSYNLALFQLDLYNGNGGVVYNTKTLNLFSVGNTEGNFTFYYFTYPVDGLQNGAPDGFALSYNGVLIPGQFLSYEGTMTGTAGVALGVLSSNVGQVEGSGTPVGHSIQLSGAGTIYSNFTWLAPAAETPGALNNGQSFPSSTLPEPSNYPADFTVSSTGITVANTWTDATGTQLPEGYLLLISNQDNLTVPVDGTPVITDLNLTDGSGAMNVAYGVQNFTFYRLQPSTTYYLAIYPYTNSGVNINYKTDGIAPEGTDTTQMLILSQDFELNTFGTWDTTSLASSKNWYIANTGGAAYSTSYYGGMNGFNQEVMSDDWLFTPALNLGNFMNEKINFFWWHQFGDVATELKLKYSADYVTGGDPSVATWTDIPFTVTETPTTWVNSGFVDISSITGNNVTFAFHYLGTATPRSWKVDEITITGDGVNDPASLNANAISSSQIDLSWTKSIDGDDVMIAYNTTNTFGTPAWGTDYAVDQTVEGTGTVIYNGAGTSFSHTSLTPGTDYFYKAWSKTAEFYYSPGITDDTTTFGAEPSEYPMDFTVNGIGITMTASWTDAAGIYLPDSYLLLISTSGSITPPVDGTPVADDRDLSDGAGAMNVAFGVQNFTFFRLSETTTYYLAIFPYSNSGAIIDFKTDGTAPSGSGITQSIINVNDMETTDFGTWDTISVSSSFNWMQLTTAPGGAYGTATTAYINGFQNGGTIMSNDWLISPSLNLRAWADEKLVFFNYWNYAPDSINELKVKYSTDYVSGDPTLATWDTLPFYQSPTAMTWVSSGFIDLSFLNSNNVHIAFNYVNKSTTQTRSWRVDEIEITGEGVSDPSNFNATTISSNEIDLSWTRNVNSNDVMIAWNSTNTFGIPEGEIGEGGEVPGGGTVIYKGQDEAYIHGGLNPATKYYYMAWSVDPDITYSAGVLDSATTQYGEPSGHPTAFLATSNSYSQITVSWTDSDAAHYLVKASLEGYGSIIPPVDMAGESDGQLVKNVIASTQSVTFNSLIPDTTYYFKIFPYNGTGESSNYKTDGEIPQASASTLPFAESLIISEVADPQDFGNSKFVELMNIGTTAIDFSVTPFYLCRQADGGASWGDVLLTGSIPAGETYIVGYNVQFVTTFGFTPNITSGNISGNGNDGYFLYYGGNHTTGILVDAYGVVNENGTGKPWYYLDRNAVRLRNVTSPNAVWTASEWFVPSYTVQAQNMTPDFHKGTITWQGTISTNWNEKSTNWDSPYNYTPDASCNVIVPYTGIVNFPVVTVNSACNSVELQTTESGSATLNITTGKTLRIMGE